MKVCIYTVDGDSLTVEDFETDTFMDFLQGWQDEHPSVLQVNIDGDSVVYFASAHIVRIDVD